MTRCKIRVVSGLIAAVLMLLAVSALATDYYVATAGSDSDPGTFAAPFATIQRAADMVSAGDTVYIRGGSYHEAVVMTGLHGTDADPIVFISYPGEEVTIDGTEAIADIAVGGWSLHSGKIYKTVLAEDVWQLFVDDRMQITARWPNAATHPADPVVRNDGTWEPEDGSWWSKTTTWAHANMDGTDANGIIENNPAYHDLAATGLSFQGGSAILALIKQGPGNGERLIESHMAGSNIFTHLPLNDSAKNKGYSSSKSFIIEHLNALDQAGEWYYTPADNTLYLWADDGLDPSSRNVRGRTMTHAFNIEDCDHVTIRGLDFFAANFRTDWGQSSTHIRIEDCHLSYPDASQRLLGIYPYDPDDSDYQTSLRGDYNALVNCVMEYTEHGAIQFNGSGTELHNNLFHHTCMLGIGYTSSILQVNKFTRNTFYISGTRAAVKTNAGPQENRIHTYNRFDGFGYQQVQTDGTALQCNSANTIGTIRAYNWFLKTKKYGSRWDGDTGLVGTNHHQIGFDMRGAMQVKGDAHLTYNNTCIGHSDKNNIMLPLDGLANPNSVTRNNLADRIAGDRSGAVSIYPIPGTHSNNWNGYITGTDAGEQLRDPVNMDFRPKAGSDVIDAGIIIPGITDGYLGAAPDIGAYEYGDDAYWIPGRQETKATMPIPADGSMYMPTDKDLMFLIGRYGTAADIYFGTDHSAVTNAVKEPAASAEYKVTLRDPNNIYSPVLEDNTTYYWRVDTVLADSSIVTGDVWSFTVGLPPDPGPVTVFYPIDDATINSAYPDNNWGSNESIRVTVNQRYCFFKFDITGFDGGVRNAVFRVKSWDNGFADLIAHPVTGDWQEETLTWNLSQDLVWGDAVDTVGPIDAQSWYEVDVNSIITGNGEFTIGLKTTATGATNRSIQRNLRILPC